MRLRILAAKLLLVVLPSFANSISTKLPEEVNSKPPDEVEKPVVEFVDESSGENQFSLRSVTTTESTTTIETFRQLTLSIGDRGNVSRDFRPSVHLGEIKESRSDPFNNVHHIGFENGAEPKNFKVVFQPTGHSSIQTDTQGSYQNSFESVAAFEEGKKEAVEQNVFVKFQDQAADVPGYHYDGLFKDQAFNQQLIHPVPENLPTRYSFADQQVFQNLEKPVYEQDASTYLGKPTKFQSDTQKHELASFTDVDPLRTQYQVGFYEPQNHQTSLQDLEAFKRPNDGAVFVQESSFTRTKKFPYPFSQPPVGYHQVEVVNDDHSTYPVRRRVSPWKKILHLIGAFLPIGLLVAALTPNVVKVGNNTQPNIVLSKWRVADLPVEHKQVRFNGDHATICEERSICDAILAGGEAGSTVLQNILWNMAIRTSSVAAKECGLQEVFEAVKKKDCTTVAC